MAPRRIILVMVDGVGLPPSPLGESVYSHCPTLCRLFGENTVFLDAGLGVPGLPQSATGQTAILTGCNAAEMLGEHISGFPNAELRELIRRENLFAKLLARRHSCNFANAYARLPETSLPLPLRSVTTVACEAAFGRFRDRADMFAGQAVYHDLTRHWLREKEKSNIETISEETAAEHLLGISRTVDVCLFEYFLTDHVGHRGTLSEKQRVLSSLDRFLAALLAGQDRDNELLLLVSDHGNIELLGSKLHSNNPVPWIAVGKDADRARRNMHSLIQVTPRILELFSGNGT